MDSVITSGEDAPLFRLPDLGGQLHSLTEMRGWIIVLNFWSAECEWCERVDRELLGLLDTWKDHVKVLWIASNANESHSTIEEKVNNRNIPLMLIDEDQQVADQYGALTTPHFFVVDRHGKIAYQGAWDDITFRKREATQVFVPQVLEALMRDRVPEVRQTTPYGCTLVRHINQEE